ncbi:MAG TPA: hypothetical protein VFH27_14395 [Longimicrobiaceae bacterium]|nr:hypothetical protein [Longimicrobiaceae bacterium]
MRWIRGAAALLAAGFVSAACADSTIPGPPSSAVSASRSVAAADEHAAAQEVARAVAMALQDRGMRERVRNDMRKSLLKEHKLDLSEYLHGNGGILLAKMAQQSGTPREHLLDLLSTVRPLEFYMPVAAHRESWAGGPDLLVASRLDESEAPVAFTAAGERLALDAAAPPTTPTFVLVPRETDFTQTLDPTKVKNVNDRGGTTIGTLMVVEDPCAGGGTMIVPDTCDGGGGGGGGGTYTPPPAGIYFTEMVVYDNNEPWSSGSPEVEVHIIGSKKGVVRTAYDPYNNPYRRFYPDEYELLAFDCAGASQSPAIKRFDFNGEGGAHYYQTVLFAEQSKFTATEFVVTPTEQLRRYVPMEPPFILKVVERDDGRECPVAERKTKSEITFTLEVRPGTWATYGDVSGVSGEGIRYLLQGGNDPMGEWTITSYAQLEGFSNTWLPRRTDNTEIDDVIMKVSNMGFTSTTLPGFTAYPF